MTDIQRYLSIELGRPTRLPLERLSEESYWAPVDNPALFRDATFVVEVSCNRPQTDVVRDFPEFCKIGPTNVMETLVARNLKGVPIVHKPNPPGIFVRHENVYFVLDKTSEYWAEFSVNPAVGLHFAGNWPELQLEIWAVPEAR